MSGTNDLSQRHVPSRVLFSGPIVTIGSLDCPVHHPSFRQRYQTTGYLLAFPRHAVKIRHLGSRAFVADLNTVSIYNRDQEYIREPLSPYGDYCDWLAVSPEMVIETLGQLRCLYHHRGERLFSLTHGLSSARAYLYMHALADYLDKNTLIDTLMVEETGLYVFGEVIRHAYQSRKSGVRIQRPKTTARHRQLIHTLKELLAIRYSEPLSLTQLAKEIATSPYHLCRIFQSLTGTSLHAYRNQLRLRAALHSITVEDMDLTDLALAHGFSSHSHFTQTFRKHFLVTPSVFRNANGSIFPDKLSKISIAPLRF